MMIFIDILIGFVIGIVVYRAFQRGKPIVKNGEILPFGECEYCDKPAICTCGRCSDRFCNAGCISCNRKH